MHVAPERVAQASTRTAIGVLLLTSALAAQEAPEDVLTSALERRVSAAESLAKQGRYSRATKAAGSASALLAASGASSEALAALERRAADVAAEAGRLFAEKGDSLTGDDPESLPDRIDRLVGELADPEWAVRERASRELAEIGPDAANRLKIALEDEDPEVRHRAGAILADLGSREDGRPFHCQLGVVVWVAEGRAFVDVGRAAGLVSGSKGVSFRPGEFGARLAADRVEDDWAIATVVEALGGGTVRAGDLAEFSAEFDR